MYLKKILLKIVLIAIKYEPKLHNNELADIHFTYVEANGNSRKAKYLYQEKYPNRHQPDRKLFSKTANFTRNYKCYFFNDKLNSVVIFPVAQKIIVIS